MEVAGVCSTCSELSRSLKKFEKQLNEERRWNVSQREYCIQLQQEMQKDKDLWQRQENKLLENMKDLNNKIEEMYKIIQDQHKEKVHLEYKNEVLEDNKQELQDKVNMLQDKVKHLCAEMSTAQYKSRMLEEKLTATMKLLEETHKLKARISQAEGQKSRLEMKANRLQEEKKLIEAELNNVRNENCQMQMQLIELQQNISCLDPETQQIQANNALQMKPDSLWDNGSNWGSRENNNFTDDYAAVNDSQVPTKEIEYKDRNTITFQSKCTLKLQQQTAFDNGDTAAICQVNEIHTLAPTEVANSATEYCNLDLHSIEDCVEENELKKFGSRIKDNQRTTFLEEKKTVYDTSESDSCNTCSSCGNGTQMNNYKEDLESIKKASNITSISEDLDSLRESTLGSSTGYTLKNRDEIDTVENLNAINLKEDSLSKNVPSISLCKDDLINFSSIESESFAAPDNKANQSTSHAFSHELAGDTRNGTECTCCCVEKQTDMESLNSRTLLCEAGTSQPEEYCNEISEDTEENKDRYASSFTYNTNEQHESANKQHFTEVISIASANTEIASNPITNFGLTETKEGNHTDNASSHTKCQSQNNKYIHTNKEGIITETITLKSEANQIDNLDSMKSLGNEALRESITSKNKGSLSILSKKTDNRADNHLVNKENKTQSNKCNQVENDSKLNEVNEKSNSAKGSQRVSSRGNEDSSSSEKSSQRSSPRSNKGGPNLEKKSQKVSQRGNGLNKNKGKLSDLNKKFKRMESTQQYEENNHSETTNESLNNKSNANHLLHKANMHTCSRNIQTENEILNDNATLQSETDNKEHLNSESSLETMHMGPCNSKKIKGKLSSKNNNVHNSVAKRMNAPLCSKRIQTENEIKLVSLNKITTTADSNSVHKQNTAQCSKDGVKCVALNKNKKIPNDSVVHKKTTLDNRDIQSDIGIPSNVLNKNNTNPTDHNPIHNRNLSKYDKNIQAQNGVAVGKNKNIVDDNTVCKKGTSQYNRDAHSEKGIALNKNTNSKLRYKMNALECDKDVQSKNGIQPSTSYKNNDSHLIHRNVSKCVKKIPSIMSHERNSSVGYDLVQKANIPQNNKGSQTETRVQSNTSSKSYIIDGSLVHKNQDTLIENTIQSTCLSKNSNIVGDKLEYENSSLHYNRDIQNGTVIQSIALSKHNNTNDDLTQIKNMSQHDKYKCSENENHCTSFINRSDSINDELAYKMNTLQQPISSNKNNIVNDNLEQKRDVSQSNKNIRNANGVLSSTLSKNNTTRNNDQHRNKTTQWNKDIQSEQGVHPVTLNKTALDDYFAYRRSTARCEKCAESKDRIQPITAYKRNGFVANKDLVYKCDIPKSCVCQNQLEIKLIALNENKHNVSNDLACDNTTVQCSTNHNSENESHSSEQELKVLHEIKDKYIMNTSSSEMHNDMFDFNTKATKTLTQVNSLSSSEEMNLVSAVKEGKLSNVEELLSLGTSPNCVCNGNTALHTAAETGNLHMCRLLLEAGARADARDSFSSTPLHAAAKCGNLEVGKLLVKWGASIELRDKAGNLACDIAIKNGHLGVYNWLQQQQ